MAGLFGYTHVRHLSFPAIVSLVNFILPAEKAPIASEPSPIEQHHRTADNSSLPCAEFSMRDALYIATE